MEAQGNLKASCGRFSMDVSHWNALAPDENS